MVLALRPLQAMDADDAAAHIAFGDDAHHPESLRILDHWCAAAARFAHGARGARGRVLRRTAKSSRLEIGIPVSLDQSRPGCDVVVLKRGPGVQPGPEIIAAPGHVGRLAGLEGDDVLLLAGNQGNAVSVGRFPSTLVLGVRRLA